MLPALTTHDFPRREASYAQRPEWTRPVESLWAIVSKWQFINRLPFSTLARCVSSLTRTSLYQGVDLRVLQAFNLDALAHFSGIERSSLCAGACVPKFSSTTLLLTSPNLRWCRACMNEGFHATLFQFTPITCCPIHTNRLLQACPKCRNAIPYLLDVAAAANPLACPSCSELLMSDATALTYPYQSTSNTSNLLSWQRLLAKYAYWYSNPLPASHRIHSNALVPSKSIQSQKHRLAFIGALQERSHKAPILSSNAELRASSFVTMSEGNRASNTLWIAPFTKRQWPHFQSKAFIDLCRRLGRVSEDHRKHDDPFSRHITRWWHRAWQGANARICSAQTSFLDPPFGVAEWIAFSPEPDSKQSPEKNHDNLVVRFEVDLQITWNGWSELLKQMPSCSPIGLHPRLVPPRGCWLAEPQFSPSATALGF